MNKALGLVMSKDPRAFIEECHRICYGGDSLDEDPYIDVLCDAMRDLVIPGKLPRLIVNLPPGVGKSFIMCTCLAAWYLGHHPSARIMIIQHVGKLAEDQSRNVRKILRSPAFKSAFRTRVDRTYAGSDNFGTTAGGSVYATSIKGGITGNRAELTISDDLVAISDAHKKSIIAGVNAQYDSEIASRSSGSKSVAVVIMHRLSSNDLTAHLMSKGEFKIIAIPMLAEKPETYRTSYGIWHREAGEQIRPGRYTARQIQNLMAEPSWQYLYQQGLGAESLLHIVESDFQFTDRRPDRSLPFIFSIDPGMKGGPRSSKSVIQVWQVEAGNHYLIGLFAQRCDYAELLEAFHSMQRRWPPAVLLIEDTANGSALISQLKRRVVCPIYAIVPKISKSARLRPHLQAIKNGLVNLPTSANWASDFIDDMVSFQHNGETDNVDAFTMMMDFMIRQPHLEPSKAGGGLLAVADQRGVRSIGRSPGGTERGIVALATASMFKRRR